VRKWLGQAFFTSVWIVNFWFFLKWGFE
jgi:hypothetical protein